MICRMKLRPAQSFRNVRGVTGVLWQQRLSLFSRFGGLFSNTLEIFIVFYGFLTSASVCIYVKTCQSPSKVTSAPSSKKFQWLGST